MARTNSWTETMVDWVDGRLRQNRFSNLWLGGGAGSHGGTNYRPVDGQLTQRHVCYDTSEEASPCSPSGFSSLVDNLRRIRYWQEPATWFGVTTSGAPPSGSYLNVYIKPGLWYPSTTEYCAFAGGHSPTFTLPDVLDRIDTLYIDSGGVLHIQQGVPAVLPTITLPPIASGIPLWAIHLTPTASGITHIVCSGYSTGMGYIERDLRPFLNLGGGGAAASGVPNATAEGQALVSNAALQWTANTTPLWKGEHSFETGIAFVGATTENSITIPDAQTQALHIIDSGATEFLRIDTSNNYFLIDLAGAGIKVGVGTTPTYNFDLLNTAGTAYLRVKSINDDAGIIIDCIATGDARLYWNADGNTKWGLHYYSPNNYLRLYNYVTGHTIVDFKDDDDVVFAATTTNIGIGVIPTDILHTRRDTADTQVIFESTEDIELIIRGDRSDDDESKHAWISCYQDGSARWLKIGVGECGNDNQGFIVSYETLDIFVGSTWPATTPVMIITSTGVGIGADPGTGYHLRVYDNTLDTVATFIGASSYHIKTAGITDENDNMMGLQSYMHINQAAGIVGTTVGAQATASIAAGEIGQGGALKHLEGLVMIAAQTGGTVWGDVMGMYPIVDVNAGTIGRDIIGMNLVIDVEAAVTSIGQNVYGLRVWMDVDKDPVGTVYGVHLTESTNQDYGFYQNGSAKNYFGGDVGIGIIPSYKLDVEDDVAGGFAANFFNDGDNINRYGIRVQAGADDGAAVGSTFYFYATDGDGNVTGTLLTVNGVFQLADNSDEGRKVNIRDTKIIGLDMVNKLHVRDYNWKANPNGPVMTSFVAQEAQEVFPAMVAEAPDGTLMTVRTMLIPILAKAIQELDARLTRLEAKYY